jgi:hypothetical protein
VEIGREMAAGVAYSRKRCHGGSGTSENNEQHCGAVALVSSS